MRAPRRLVFIFLLALLSPVVPWAPLALQLVYPVVLRAVLAHRVAQWVVAGRLVLLGRPLLPCMTAPVVPLLPRRVVLAHEGVEPFIVYL